MNTITVTGDFLIDYHIYEGSRRHFGDRQNPGVCVREELGGAALIHRLLVQWQKASAAEWQSQPAIDVSSAKAMIRPSSDEQDGCSDQPFSAYAFWRRYPRSPRSSEKCWRVAEAMGYGGRPGGSNEWPWPVNTSIPKNPAVLVISDGGMGFRSRRNLANWGFTVQDRRLRELFSATQGDGENGGSQLSSDSEPRWIVLKTSAPVSEGDLWRELSEFYAEKLVVIVAAQELRQVGVRLSQGLSWEQTLEDLHQALASHPVLQALLRARHLIIPFDTEGALWIDRSGHHLKAAFFFDADHIERERRDGVDGAVYGMLSCFTAMIAAEFAAHPEDPDFQRGIRNGLHAMQFLLETGHGSAESGQRGTGFPARQLAEYLAQSKRTGSVHVRSWSCEKGSCPVRPGWSLLALHETPDISAADIPLYGIAQRVLNQGHGVLKSPTLKVGNFFTADRGEIESLRSLRQLVRRYLSDRRADKPLSIGVFGPPGAGKSFAVREMARQLLGDQLGWLEFNLSQFNGPTDLIGALHQVRDKGLEGRIPVAFFDEFDSQNLDWLKYLLGPMQDGRFQEGQLSHPIGQSLFVFAGGTSHTFEQFASRGEGHGETADFFVRAKGPDFASRLDARLNVVGPNPRISADGSGEDIFFPVRRALFIRARWGCRDGERVRMHPALATLLLQLPRFRHGARSLTKLIEPFRQLRRSDPSATLNLSLLPPRDQLALLVNPTDLDRLIQRDEEIVFHLGVDRLAAAVHSFYRNMGKTGGWIKPHHDCEFEDLSPFDQASNRAAARRIPSILALAGLRLELGTPAMDEESFARLRLQFHEELLAEAEHDGWVDWHLDNDWRFAETRNDSLQQNHLLIPYCNLEDGQRDKDREAIRHYPEIAKLAGMKIVAAVWLSGLSGADVSE